MKLKTVWQMQWVHKINQDETTEVKKERTKVGLPIIFGKPLLVVNVGRGPSVPVHVHPVGLPSDLGRMKGRVVHHHFSQGGEWLICQCGRNIEKTLMMTLKITGVSAWRIMNILTTLVTARIISRVVSEHFPFVPMFREDVLVELGNEAETFSLEPMALAQPAWPPARMVRVFDVPSTHSITWKPRVRILARCDDGGPVVDRAIPEIRRIHI